MPAMCCLEHKLGIQFVSRRRGISAQMKAEVIQCSVRLIGATANRSYGEQVSRNVGFLNKGDGLEQVHAQCLGHEVQVPAYSIVIQATALAVKACFQVVGGCLWPVGCHPKSVGRCFNSAGCCFELGRSSVSALLQAPGAPAKMVRHQQGLLRHRGCSRPRGGSSRPPVTKPLLHCCRCNCRGRAKANPL